MTASSSTVYYNAAPKPVGWCDREGIEHSWEAGPTLTVDPPIHTRRCKNCGQEQRQSPSTWVDSN